jgi:hypothetical protein
VFIVLRATFVTNNSNPIDMKFFFHYNKPKSQQEGKPQISLHYNKQCHIVDNLVINVPTNGKIRNEQPYFVVEGEAENIEIYDNNVAYIN